MERDEHAGIPQRLLRSRRRADILQWFVYVILWGAVVVGGDVAGRQLGSARAGLITGLGIIVVCLFYAIVCLSWHARSLVQTDQAPADVARIRCLLEPLCQRANISVPHIFILRTPAANAFAAGVLSRMRSVGVTRGALDLLNDRELQAVLAHEVTHLQRRDSLFDGWWIALSGVVIFVSALTIRYGYAALQTKTRRETKKEDDSGALLGLFLIIVGVVFGIVAYVLIQLLLHQIMRRREYRADEGAVLLTGSVTPLISALRKLESRGEPMLEHHTAVAMLFSVNPLPTRRWLDALFATHPRMSKRIGRLQAIGKELGEIVE